MIGLDTNILVRYLTQDHPAQSSRASALIENVLTAENPGFVSAIALVETVWVLGSVYALTNHEIAARLETILRAETLVLEQEYDVFLATTALEDGSDFADALIGAVGLKAGCSHTLTFDRKASQLPGFELLS